VSIAAQVAKAVRWTPVDVRQAVTRTAGYGPVRTFIREITMSTTTPSLYEAVKASRLAEGLSPEQVRVLADQLTLEPLQAHQVLAREGSVDNRLYVIAQGSVVVVTHIGTPEETTLLTLEAGDFVHELGFLDGAPRYASLVAASPGQVLVLERERLESLIDTHPRIVYGVMCAIVRVVHRIQTRLSVQASELTNYIVKQNGRY
jgi:CRP-like cAMP-binding protein